MLTPYFQDDHVTLYHGDCIEIMRGLPDASVQTVLTDPPYSSGGRRENSRSLRKSMTRSMEDEDWIRGDAMSTNGFTYLMRMCAIQWRRVLVNGGHAMSFIDWRMAHHVAAAMETADLRQQPTLIWDKDRFGMGSIFRNQYELVVHFTVGTPPSPQRRDVANVIRCRPVRSEDHPTEKPGDLLDTLLSVVAPPGSTVLDPFAGSGSTLETARKRGLHAIGVEADEAYCETIANRLSQDILDFGAIA